MTDFSYGQFVELNKYPSSALARGDVFENLGRSIVGLLKESKTGKLIIKKIEIKEISKNEMYGDCLGYKLTVEK